MTISVLIVDDDEDSRELLAEILCSRGFTVRTACSGAACMQVLNAVLGIAIVVTDVEMPGMTGLELCDALRSHYPMIITIVMSGRVTKNAESEAKLRGAVAFIPKPANIDTLERVLRQAMV